MHCCCTQQSKIDGKSFENRTEFLGVQIMFYMYLFLRLVNAELAKYEKYQRFVQCTMLCQEEFERMVIDEMFNMFKNCIVRLHFKQNKEFHRK